MSLLSRIAALRIPRSKAGKKIGEQLDQAFRKYEEPTDAITTLSQILTQHFAVFEPLKDRQSNRMTKEMTKLYRLTSPDYNQTNPVVGSTILDRTTNTFSRRVVQSYQEVVAELENQMRQYFRTLPLPFREPNVDASRFEFAKDRRNQVKKTMIRLADIAEYERPKKGKSEQKKSPPDRIQE